MYSFMRPAFAILSIPFLLASCNGESVDSFNLRDKHDRYQELDREDYRSLTNPQTKNGETQITAELGAPPIPDVADILAAPRPPKINQSKLVSIAVTEDVAIRDVLFELARLADVDIEIGGGIEGGINFRATKKPFNQVIERIADLAGLRYAIKGGVLRVERDSAYIRNYSLDFLNIVRSSESTVTINTDVLASTAGGGQGQGGGAGGGGGGGGGGGQQAQGLTSGTTASITATSESDLWAALDASVAEILNYNPGIAGAASGTPAGAGGPGYVINRQAGVLSVSASERQHDLIDRFLNTMKRNVSAQVVIEAKILEVTLNDAFRTGINWDGVLERANIDVNFQPATAIGNGITFGLRGGTRGSTSVLDDVVSATQEFGTTRTLSSPRLHAINNQQSVLTFAENRIFFTCNQNQGNTVTTGGGATTETGAAFTCERGVIPIGIILAIQPSINVETQEVTLNVRPTLSRQVDEVQDPGTAIAAAANDLDNLTSAIPVVEVRELDSVMKIKNGGVMVIGGLLEDVGTNQSNGIPILSDVPLLGNAFKSREEVNAKRELIIFIKATIVASDGHYVPADKRSYEKFGTDSRPLGL